MTHEHHCMCLGETTGDCRPVEVDVDIWTQVTQHGPGNQTSGGKIANRSIIYRLHGPDGPFLVLLNALWVKSPDAPAIQAIRALSAELGCPLRFILTPGSMHNINLPTYAKAFPDARVCIPRGRIPRANPQLLLEPNVEVYPVDAPPPELAEAGLQVLVFQGMCEGPATAKFMRMSGVFGYVTGSAEPQVFLHEPTGTITNGGHHMWYRHGDDEIMEMSPSMRRMMGWLGMSFDIEPDSLWLETNGSFAMSDPDLVQASARRILSWSFDKMIDIHAPPGGLVREGAYAIWERALAPIEAGDWDRVPWKVADRSPPATRTMRTTFRFEGTVEMLWDAMFDYDLEVPGLDLKMEELAPGLTGPNTAGSYRALRAAGRAPIIEEIVESVPYRSVAYRIYSGGPYAYYQGRGTLRQDGDEVVMDYEADVIPKYPLTMWFLRLTTWFANRRVVRPVLASMLEQHRVKRLATEDRNVA